MRYTALAILITVAIFALWLQEDVKKKPDPDALPTSRFPDYFMENFSITNMNESGKPTYILKAEKMLHYSDEDYSELEQPVMTFSDAKNSFTITASGAKFLQSKNTIHLNDNVIVHRAATPDQSELSIYTDYLKINTQTRIAETDQPARIKTAKAELNTRGLVFDNMRGVIKLKSQVKGIYESTR